MENAGERAGAMPSFWERTAQKFSTSPLRGDITADVCVIGAGIAGVTTAYLAARDNRQVVLIDDGPVGGGMTGRTTAHLVNAIDDRYIDIEKFLGEECARLTAESHTAAIDCAERIAREHNIGCDFERLDGYLFLAARWFDQRIDGGIGGNSPCGFTCRRARRFSTQYQHHFGRGAAVSETGAVSSIEISQRRCGCDR